MAVNNYKDRLNKMVKEQIIDRGIVDGNLISAFKSIPRHIFLPDELKEYAYEDRAIPLGPNQSISQPYIVALMIEALNPMPSDTVLEVGSGSGYAAAILSRLVKRVIGLELEEKLVKKAQESIRELGIDNVEFIVRDGLLGYSKYAPYDKILVSAAATSIPRELIKELRSQGAMILPLGDEYAQELILIKKQDDSSLEVDELGAVQFVSLTSKERNG